MAILPNIKLSERELNNLLQNAISRGAEAIICPGSKDDRLSKLFVNPFELQWSNDIKTTDLREMTDNKLCKLKALYQQDVEWMVRPLSTISYKGSLLGYEMTYDKDDITLSSPLISKTSDEFAHYAIESQEVLQYYNKLGIIYGDVAARNILVNRKTKQAKFCDIDNIQYQGYPIDSKTIQLLLYEQSNGSDSNTDIYMHNLMLLDSFNLSSDDINDNSELFQEHFDEFAISIYSSMLYPENFTGESAAKYIKTRK